MSVPRVAICVPYYRQVEGPTAMCFMSMGFAIGGQVGAVPISTKGAYIEDNRNGCVEFAMNLDKRWRETEQPGFDWLLWIDTDMEFPPDALLRLMAHDKDIIGANYRQRTPPYAAAGVYEDGTDLHLLEPGLHRMRQLPTGLLLTRFDIYRQMGYPWFRPGLHSEARDDIWFCREAAARGYEIWCDHDLTFEVIHNDGYQIPWFRPDQIVRQEGAIIDNTRAAEAGRQRAILAADGLTAQGRSAA